MTFIPEKTFTIFNTHFPLGKTHRMETAEFIKHIKCNSSCYFIVGDMNTFYDDGGQDMIDIIESNPNNKQIDILPDEPTFSSFPHDRIQATSRLDHIIASGDYILESVKIYNNKDYVNRPSDHFLCEITINI